MLLVRCFGTLALYCIYYNFQVDSKQTELKCGHIRIDPWKGLSIFGGRSVLCKQYHVSYQSCKLLLAQNQNCSALIYEDKICTLLDRRQADFRVTKSNVHVAIAMKLIPQLDKCKSHVAIQHISPTRRYEKCLHTKTKSYIRRNKLRTIDSFKSFSSLPLLNIVISVTQSWIERSQTELDLIVAHWQCYAKLHGYLFTLNVLQSAGANEFFVERHESIMKTYLPYAQWVLHLDADSIVLNMSRTLDDFISRHQLSSNPNPYGSDHAIILQVRENTEITSGIYLVRNDPRSYCFLEYWRSFHPPWTPPTPQKPSRSVIPVPNNCNGALVAAVLLLATGDAGIKCLENLQYNLITRPFPYPEQACSIKNRTRIYELSQLDTSTDLTKFGIRLLWHREGLWRSHEKDDPKYAKSGLWRLFNRCYPSSELIGHGNKNIASEMLESHHSTQCDMNMKSDPVRSINGKCKWYNMTEEMDVLRHYCLWRSPACVTTMKKEGGNRCVEPSRGESVIGMIMNDKCVPYHNMIATDFRTVRNSLSGTALIKSDSMLEKLDFR
eukprot:gene11883-24897_t